MGSSSAPVRPGPLHTPASIPSCDFPRLDPRLEGRPNRYGYSVEFGHENAELQMKTLLKYDLDERRTEVHDFGQGISPGEGVFAPAAPDAGEDEGFVLAFTHDENDGASELQILDAQNFTGDPVASIRIPQRVPVGFHANWLPDAR